MSVGAAEVLTNSPNIDIPRLLVVLLTAGIIFFLSIDLVRAKGKASVDSPSSFFPLDKVISKAAFSVAYLFFSGTIAVLYAAIALDSGNVLSTVRKLLGAYAMQSASANLKPSVEALFAAIPSWFEPLFVFIVFLLLFGDRVQKWLLYLRDAIIRSSGIYSLIDNGARSTATSLMLASNNDYDMARVKLETLTGECPVPEEYVSKKDARRLAYQILWAIQGSVLIDGFTAANNNLKIRLGLPAPPHIRTRFTRVAAAAVFYIILMALFISVCRLLTQTMETRFGFLWSDTTGCIRLSLKFTMAFTLPLLLAVSVYPLRRRAYHDCETRFQSIATVAAMQFSISFILHEIYNVIEAFVMFSNTDTNSLLDAKTHITTFLYSLTPILAFLAILLSRKVRRQPLIAYALICVFSGAAFALCDFIYELRKPALDYYFVHQFVFGFWITLAFIICSHIRRN